MQLHSFATSPGPCGIPANRRHTVWKLSHSERYVGIACLQVNEEGHSLERNHETESGSNWVDYRKEKQGSGRKPCCYIYWSSRVQTSVQVPVIFTDFSCSSSVTRSTCRENILN
jgi:hypothetical protein